jgi:hypothetical protein
MAGSKVVWRRSFQAFTPISSITEISILTLTGGVGVAYKANDWLSIGANAGAVFATLDFDLAVPPLLPMGSEGAAVQMASASLPSFFCRR